MPQHPDARQRARRGRAGDRARPDAQRPALTGRQPRRCAPRQAVRITLMCSVPLSGSQTSPARPRIWRTPAPSFGSAMRVNFSRRRIEAEDRVAAEVAQPDLVAIVDVDRVGLGVVARQLPRAPGRLGGVVHRDVAAQPFADPDAALAVAPDPARALARRRRLDDRRLAGRAVDAGDERAGERAPPDVAAAASCRCRTGRCRAARPYRDAAGLGRDLADEAALAGEPEVAVAIEGRGVEVRVRRAGGQREARAPRGRASRRERSRSGRRR